MFWILLQIIYITASGTMVPDAVVVPESTLIPPPEIIQISEPQPEQKPNPAYLFIPSIGVSAAIDPVGLTENGAVDVPTEPGLLGWFDRSPTPGSPGSAIIDGHRGWRNKTPAVFDRLEEMMVGDMVIVMNDAGETMPFVVYDIRTYDSNESPPEVFEPSDTPRLNLITCNGQWDAVLHSATKRLVVFTEPFYQ